MSEVCQCCESVGVDEKVEMRITATDLDGTVLETVLLCRKCCRDVIANAGGHIPERKEE